MGVGEMGRESDDGNSLKVILNDQREQSPS